MEIQEFIKDRSAGCGGKAILIYGTSMFAACIASIFRICGQEITAYVVSDSYKNEDYFNGKPVYEVSRLPYQPEECCIFGAIGSHHQADVLHNLDAAGCPEIRFISVQEYQTCALQLYQAYLEQQHIPYDGKTISLQGLRLNNLFISAASQPDKDAFLLEFGDILFPSLLSETRFLVEGPYEYQKVQVKDGDTVLDCGANLGLFSCLAAKKGGNIYAFEPLGRAVKNLEFICAHYLDSICINQTALSDHSGTDVFWESADIGSSRLEYAAGLELRNHDKDSLVKSYQVPVTTIDKFVEQNNLKHVDFIKADIEGAERFMLMGAERTLREFGPKLAVCTYHLADDPEVLEGIIKKANPKYRIEHKWMKLYAYIP